MAEVLEIRKNNEVNQLQVVDSPSDFTLTLVHAVIEKGLSTETLEKILNMRDTLLKEKAKSEFYKALTQFQAEVPTIQKDQVVLNKDGSVRYKYASLDKITETIKPFLAKYGLSYRFETSFEEKHIEIKCIITHIMGHSEVTSFKIPVDSSPHMSDIQKYGSSITYARRYALSLALGLTTDEDDDNNVDTVIQTDKENENNQKNQGEMITEAQLKALFALLKDKTKEERLQIVSSIINRQVTSSRELTKREASRIIEVLKNGEEPF